MTDERNTILCRIPRKSHRATQPHPRVNQTYPSTSDTECLIGKSIKWRVFVIDERKPEKRTAGSVPPWPVNRWQHLHVHKSLQQRPICGTISVYFMTDGVFWGPIHSPKSTGRWVLREERAWRLEMEERSGDQRGGRASWRKGEKNERIFGGEFWYLIHDMFGDFCGRFLVLPLSLPRVLISLDDMKNPSFSSSKAEGRVPPKNRVRKRERNRERERGKESWKEEEEEQTPGGGEEPGSETKGISEMSGTSGDTGFSARASGGRGFIGEDVGVILRRRGLPSLRFYFGLWKGGDSSCVCCVVVMIMKIMLILVLMVWALVLIVILRTINE